MTGQRRNTGKALPGLVLQQEGVKASNGCPCSLPAEGRLVPKMGLGWLGLRGGLGGLPTPLVVLCAGTMCGALLCSQDLTSLCLIVHNLSQLQIHTVSLVPYSFPYSVAQGEFVQVQIL